MQQNGSNKRFAAFRATLGQIYARSCTGFRGSARAASPVPEGGHGLGRQHHLPQQLESFAMPGVQAVIWVATEETCQHQQHVLDLKRDELARG